MGIRIPEKLPKTVQSESFQSWLSGLRNVDNLGSYYLLGQTLSSHAAHGDISCLCGAGWSFLSAADAALGLIVQEWGPQLDQYPCTPDELIACCHKLANVCNR